MRFALISSYVALFVHMAVGIVSVPLFIRAFGAERYGFWGALLGVTSYLSLLHLGIAQTVASRISTRVNDSRDAVARIVRLGFALYTRGCVIGLAVVLPIALLIPWAQLFKLDPAVAGEARLTAFCVALFFICELPFSVFRAALVGLGKLGPERTITCVTSLLRLCAALVFTYLHVSLWLGVMLLSAVNFLGHAACIHYLRSRQGIPIVLSPHVPPADAAEAATFRTTGHWYLLLQLTGAVLWGTDPFLAGVLVDSSAAAHVTITWRVMVLLLNLGTAVGPVLGPLLARHWAQGDIAATARIGLASARLVVGVVTIGALCVFGASDTLFHAWLSDSELIPDPVLIACYGAIVIINGWMVIPEAFITQSGNHRKFSICTAAEAVLKLVFSVVLTGMYGLIGVPLGAFLGRFLTTIWFLPAQYVAHSKIRHREFVSMILGSSMIPGLAFLTGYWASTQVIGKNSAQEELACTALSALCFGLAYLAFGLPDEVRRRIPLMRRFSLSQNHSE